MTNFHSFLDPLVQLGPQFPIVRRVVKTLIREFNFGQKLPPAEAPMSPAELAHIETLRSLAATHGSLADSPPSDQELLQDFNFIQQHPELVAAFEAIVGAFKGPKPTPTPLAIRE